MLLFDLPQNIESSVSISKVCTLYTRFHSCLILFENRAKKIYLLLYLYQQRSIGSCFFHSWLAFISNDSFLSSAHLCLSIYRALPTKLPFNSFYIYFLFHCAASESPCDAVDLLIPSRGFSLVTTTALKKREKKHKGKKDGKKKNRNALGDGEEVLKWTTAVAIETGLASHTRENQWERHERCCGLGCTSDGPVLNHNFNKEAPKCEVGTSIDTKGLFLNK